LAEDPSEASTTYSETVATMTRVGVRAQVCDGLERAGAGVRAQVCNGLERAGTGVRAQVCDGLERAGTGVRAQVCDGLERVGAGARMASQGCICAQCTSCCYFVLEEASRPEPWQRLQLRSPFRPVPLQKVQAASDIAILQGY
jgi:hypothetical protein